MGRIIWTIIKGTLRSINGARFVGYKTAAACLRVRM
jgi:hypothetical protein